MTLKITSKSQLSDKETFNLKIFKEPFCNNETQKKYKLYETPKFKTKYFKKIGNKEFIKEKTLFVSGPARSGNHLVLSLLDGHSQIAHDIGEDDFLRTVFSYANTNEQYTVKKLIKADLNFLLKLSGQPKYGKGPGIDKWKKLNEIFTKNEKSNIWSGNQKEGEAHITDFQEIIPKINYRDFKKYLGEKKSKLRKSKYFLETFQIYLEAKKKLIFNHEKYEKKYVYKNRWLGSGLRRELFYLLERSNNIICITPIRKFENFYYSYAKTRHFTTKVEQKALNDLWEHWRHKVIDYLILKKKYPNKIIILKYEDLVNNTEKKLKMLCKKLKIKFEKKMLSTTVLGTQSLGNSSFKKSKSVKGKVYDNSINRKLGIKMPKEYKQIYSLIDKVCL